MFARTFEALALGGLLAWSLLLLATILHDVVRHEPRTLTTPAPAAGMTATGVPWVAGPPREDPSHAQGQSGVRADDHQAELRHRLTEPVAAAVAH